jgi:mannose-6-phosphate isomerase-like protein (cupin superfamily)
MEGVMDSAQADGRRAGPYLLAPGEVRRNPASVPIVKADSADTAGLLAVFEDTMAPWAAGPPLHLHTREDEALYVLEGTVLVQIGEQRHELAAGAFAWIPRDTPHTFANASGTATRVLALAVPGGIEGLFADQGVYFAQLRGAPDLAELGQIGARYGSRLLGPPITASSAPVTQPS